MTCECCLAPKEQCSCYMVHVSEAAYYEKPPCEQPLSLPPGSEIHHWSSDPSAPPYTYRSGTLNTVVDHAQRITLLEQKIARLGTLTLRFDLFEAAFCHQQRQIDELKEQFIKYCLRNEVDGR